MNRIDLGDQLVDICQRLLSIGELPIASVVALDGRVVGATPVSRRTSPYEHAEMTALDAVSEWPDDETSGRDFEMFSVVEPCAMCFSAAAIRNVRRIAYWLPAADDGVTTTEPVLLPQGPELVHHPDTRFEIFELLRTYDSEDHGRSGYARALLDRYATSHRHD